MSEPERRYVTHSLKTWPMQFAAVWSGEKTHEVRKFDRDFRTDDTVFLYEYDPDLQKFGSRTVRARIRYITSPGTFGLPPDIGVFTLHLISRDHVTPAQAQSHCEEGAK